MLGSIFRLVAGLVVIGAVGYVIYYGIDRYADNPIMLMTIMVPVVAALAYLFQSMR